MLFMPSAYRYVLHCSCREAEKCTLACIMLKQYLYSYVLKQWMIVIQNVQKYLSLNSLTCV